MISFFVRSLRTSDAINNPADAGTKALLPGMSRLTVHFLVPAGHTQ